MDAVAPLRAETAELRAALSAATAGSSRERRAPALWRGGEVQLDRLAAGAGARLDGDVSGTGLEDQRRGLLGAVDADPTEQPAARAIATRLVRCQSEALASSRLHAGQRRRKKANLLNWLL